MTATATADSHRNRPCLRRTAGTGDDRGSVSIEIVLAEVPLMVLAALVIIACLRLASADSDVHAAAAAAARQASLAHTPAEAVAGAHSAAGATLQRRGITCRTSTVTVDATALTPGGQVTVSIVCEVRFEDLVGLGLPGSATVTATASQPVDRYIGIPLGLASPTPAGREPTWWCQESRRSVSLSRLRLDPTFHRQPISGPQQAIGWKRRHA